MRYVLSKNSRTVLTRLTHEKTLYAFDFDGTLSPIVAEPRIAALRAETRQLLSRLASRFPCIVISGRARADVLGRLGDINIARVIGNHGAETEAPLDVSEERAKCVMQVKQWRDALEPRLLDVPGLWVEDKGLSLAVHYRKSPHKRQVRRQILEAANNLEGVRVFGGKQVVNIVQRNAPQKGEALAAERDRLGCSWVLYVGDDENDEDAFALDGNIIAVRIGRKQRSHAHFYLRTQSEIDRLLELLAPDTQ